MPYLNLPQPPQNSVLPCSESAHGWHALLARGIERDAALGLQCAARRVSGAADAVGGRAAGGAGVRCRCGTAVTATQ